MSKPKNPSRFATGTKYSIIPYNANLMNLGQSRTRNPDTLLGLDCSHSISVAEMDNRNNSSVNLVKKGNGNCDQSTSGCGFGPWRPRCLQIFAKPIVFLILLNIYCIVEGTIVSGKTLMFIERCSCIDHWLAATWLTPAMRPHISTVGL